MMIKLFLILTLAASTVALADDNLLRNGDFSNGISHWDGDLHPPDSGGGDIAAPESQTSGAVIKLRKDEWSKITQDFEGRTGDYTLTINYSISDDLQFSRNPDDYTNLASKIQFSLLGMTECDSGDVIVVLTDYGMKSSNSSALAPTYNGAGAQSLTTHFHFKTSNNRGLCIAFPPGQGVITLHSITLSP